jgi:hypothetical protein
MQKPNKRSVSDDVKYLRLDLDFIHGYIAIWAQDSTYFGRYGLDACAIDTFPNAMRFHCHHDTVCMVKVK